MPQKKATDIAPISPEALRDLLHDIWHLYPERDIPHLYQAARRTVAQQLAAGASPQQLLDAAREYARHVEREQTPLRYRKSMHLFFKDEMWRHFAVPRVHGLTREEWARSGRDTLEFDTLADVQHYQTTAEFPVKPFHEEGAA